MQHKAEIVTDVSMVGLLAGVWIELLPVAVSFVTLIWFCIRIYETDTMQKLLKRKKKKDDS